MKKSIKLIWDFHGPDAEKIAEHHRIHLEEFVQKEKVGLENNGVEQKTDQHYIAFMLCEEKDVYKLRDSLKPHRAEIV